MLRVSLLFSLLTLPDVATELRRFPPSEVIEEYLALNRGYQAHLESGRLLAPHHEDELRAALRDARLLYGIWDKLDDARGRCSEAARWDALRELRALIGDEAYCRGRMPPPVPLWRFHEIP